MSEHVPLNQRLFDLPLLHSLGRSIHTRRLAREPRGQSTATRFFRNLRQLDALQGPLRPLIDGGDPIRILVAGCSFGCEAYSLAAYLAVEFPALDWTIDAFDIAPDAVAVAQRAVYGSKYGLADPLHGEARRYASRLLEPSGDAWAIAPDIRQRVRISHGDLLASDFSNTARYDVVFAQNFLLHMDDATAAIAFARVVGASRPGGALFVAGMNLDSKLALVRSHRLIAVDWEIEAIHNSDQMRRSAWPWGYWTLEPIDASRPDFVMRYSTIFRTPGKLAAKG
ncbi:MAG: Chemotaxis protein methyltransferase [Accumulibacter sp.]|uniref:CheR family methyltransferase n=1 Tax=Accumulibacter sp. TaxID=2053492 RepID=UPI0012055F3E|nr:CheR family methyltransferase [Accumulibacter sp.]TLD44323.1 MAG: Chemotaxis protein methyltransferase [Accumulibacter sp.]